VGSPYFVHDSPDGQLRVLFLGYMFDFTHFASNVHVVTVADSLEEAYFAEAMAVPDVDLYVVLGHIDIVMEETEQIREAVRVRHPTTPIVFMSGHRHIKSYKQLDENCVAIESWRYFKALGHLSLQLDTSASPNALNNRLQAVSHRWVDTSRDNFYELTGRNASNFLTPDGASLKQAIQDTNSMLGLDQVLGCAPTTYEPSVPLEWDTSLFGLLLTEMYPRVVYNTAQKKNKQLAILNTSSLRNPLYEGTVDRNDIYTVDPFNNVYGSVDALSGGLVLSLLDFLNNQPRELVQWYSCGAEFAASGLPHFVISPDEVIDENTIYDIVCTSVG
jgi:2',3'-cyclic-nucleotide 2'-phosphodiesterase (5'-nucleotidase family)